MIKQLKILFFCRLFDFHDWTSKSMEGVKPNLPENPTTQQLVESLNDSCRLYCKRCGEDSKFNEKFKFQ